MSSSQSPIDELAERVSRMLQIYRQPSPSRWHQTVEALKCFKGQTLTGLPPKLRRHLESQMVAISKITASYPIETWEDYQMLSDTELDEIRNLLEGIAFSY